MKQARSREHEAGAADGEAELDASLRRFHAARDAGLDVGDPGVLQRLAFDDG